MHSVLMILSSATIWTQKDGRQRPTGFWAEEFTVPHEILRKAGVRITIATPSGAPAVVDQLSLSAQANQGNESTLAEISAYLESHSALLQSPLCIEDINIDEYDAVFVPGGHGPMQDLAVNEAVGRVLDAALANPKKVVAAVCHGPASFLSAGSATAWAFKGRKITAFSNEEETQVGLAANAPWLLEDRLRAAGAVFEAAATWQPHILIDGNLVTGQNPASAAGVATAVLDLLQKRGS